MSSVETATPPKSDNTTAERRRRDTCHGAGNNCHDRPENNGQGDSCHNDRENRFIFQGPVDDKVQERAKENGESDGSHKCNNECPGAVQQRNSSRAETKKKLT